MHKLFALAVFSLALFADTCNAPPEKVAYQVEVSAGAFIQSIQRQHPECPTSTTAICEYLPRAVAAQHALADAIDVYCAGPNYNQGGKCDAPAKGTPAYQQATDKLRAAVSNYQKIEADLKAAIAWRPH